jgi:hypothetical protein
MCPAWVKFYAIILSVIAWGKLAHRVEGSACSVLSYFSALLSLCQFLLDQTMPRHPSKLISLVYRHILIGKESVAEKSRKHAGPQGYSPQIADDSSLI